MVIDFEKIGAKIQFFRIMQGVSQEALSDAASVSRRYITDMERGAKGASLETFIAIVRKLRISADDILADYLTPDRPSFYSISMEVFSDCTKEEADFLIAILRSTKQILRKYKITE